VAQATGVIEVTEVHIPGAPAIDGLHFRTYAGHSDIPDMTRVMNAAVIENDNPEWRSEASVQNMLDHSSSTDPYQDVLLAFVGDELTAASFARFEDANEGMRQYQSFGFVEPRWRRHGIGGAMSFRQEMRLREIARSHVQPTPPVLVTWVDGSDIGADALVRANDYRQVRTYHHMVRPDMDHILLPAVPPEIIIRPVRRDELHSIWDAMSEAFRDHFGAMDTSDASFERWTRSPNMDPSLLFVAFDGSEVASGVQGNITPGENEARGYLRGWTDPIFTRRHWRRRGLASACLGRTLEALSGRGMASAQLGVDTENPNDALSLYRKHRFESVQTETEWHKPLKP
jgi:mycothiol synthase